MTLYEQNLRVLAEIYPQMDVLINNARKDSDSEIEVLIERAYDGNEIFKVKKGEKVFYLNGKRDTQEAAKIWVETLGELPTNTPVFIMGVGNYFYLLELAERMKNKLTIIVYEPSLHIFVKFLETVPINKMMEKHLIVFWVDGLEGMDTEALSKMMEKVIFYEKLPYAKELLLPNYDVLFPKEMIAFLKLIQEQADEEIVQYNTKARFASVIGKNIISNLKYLCNAYKTTQLIEVIPRDIPGIVVAAGPSLNKNIRVLKKAKGRAFIIAVDTAIKPLLNEGIIPDMFAIVDGKKPLDLVEREEVKGIPLVTTLNAASDILDFHTGMKFFFNEGFTFADTILLRADKRWGGVNTGGSVATNAFSLLHKIGLERIILVGQDLAFTDKKSHADGTFSDVIEQVSDVSGFIMVEGNEGEKVPTTGSLKTYLDWYNQHIKGIRELNKNFRVINATEGGAKIENTEIMTLEEAVARECKRQIDIQKCFEKLPPMLNEEDKQWAKEYLISIPEKLKKLAADASKTEKAYKKLERMCNGKNFDRKEYLSILKRIKNLTYKMEINDAYQLIDVTMVEAQYIMRDEQYMYESNMEEEVKEIARKGILYTAFVKKMSLLFEEYTKDIFGNFFGDDGTNKK